MTDRKDIADVQIVTTIPLEKLANEIGWQAGGDGLTYEDIIEFVLTIDALIGDSVFTEGLRNRLL